MSLGPTKLTPAANRSIIKRKEYRAALREYDANRIGWGDESLSRLKKLIRLSLRAQQDGRCIYCRRKIKIERRNASEDIEHFLDKSKRNYRKWSFAYENLTLACHPCNFEKSTRDLGSATIAVATNYPKGAGLYKWLHPYFDDYHANISIGKGWTYTIKQGAPAAAQAIAMIQDCKLGAVETIEAHATAIKNYIYRLTVLARKAMKRNKKDLALRLIEKSESYQNQHWYDL